MTLRYLLAKAIVEGIGISQVRNEFACFQELLGLMMFHAYIS